ncbi:MAG: hypothetical protein JAY75_16360 [Candidatus Thiodiazotropha taylori]|nr:hypothetical protein [Candidatus Thiodiazotropha taylori]MCG8095357.1 hypothetical protein [Candidatus Thiodiazotropha endolucinida]MCG7881327.1 hypothetical protein [Candidatus Thiodiazotropha taylori]MCG7888531.1 hypothetical protein [Candidatus Thiodiazotropha taylori]MCG7892275.1 hypothetical protein [Candidatus Thiodiazotropha taylori]
MHSTNYETTDKALEVLEELAQSQIMMNDAYSRFKKIFNQAQFEDEYLSELLRHAYQTSEVLNWLDETLGHIETSVIAKAIRRGSPWNEDYKIKSDEYDELDFDDLDALDDAEEQQGEAA